MPGHLRATIGEKKHLQANISRLNRVNTNGEVGESFVRFGNASFKGYFSRHPE